MLDINSEINQQIYLHSYKFSVDCRAIRITTVSTVSTAQTSLKISLFIR